jgi:Transglutaminase-like superfamily
MKRLILESWLLLLYFEFVIRFGGLKQLRSVVRNQRVTTVSLGHQGSSAELCRAMDFACVFYFKVVLCLQRSAATALLLRRHGRDAEMVIGAQLTPFKSHAWVEIDAVVVNDRPYMLEIYRVLDRC